MQITHSQTKETVAVPDDVIEAIVKIYWAHRVENLDPEIDILGKWLTAHGLTLDAAIEAYEEWYAYETEKSYEKYKQEQAA